MKEKKLVWLLLGGIFVLVVLLVGVLLGEKNTGVKIFGGQSDTQGTQYQVMAGSVPSDGTADVFCYMPSSFVDENSTTTDATKHGCTINQLLDVAGVETITLQVNGKAGTATSTLFTLLRGSYDGVNWFDMTGTATSSDSIGTSTPSLAKRVIGIDLGIASTTATVPINIDPVNYLRLSFYGEDLSTDPADGVKANIITSWLQK